MALGPRLDLRQSQSLVMTPQLQQAIKLLALSNLEIETFIGEALEANPLLDAGDLALQRTATDAPVAEEPAPEPTADDLITRGHGEADAPLDIDPAALDRDRDTGDWSAASAQTPSAEWEPDQASAQGLSLAEHLGSQIGAQRADPAVLAIARHLIGLLEDTGYLTVPLRTIAEDLGSPLALVEQALQAVQALDPTGVGARSLAECLALQAREADRYDPCMARLIDNLELVARGAVPQLKRICGVDDEDLADMLAELRGYDPRPGLRFGTEVREPVVPDVLITRAPAGGWDIALNEATLPRLVINRAYLVELRGGCTDKASRRWLGEKLQDANWLLKALDQRQKTILKVAAEIVKQQEGFFLNGVSALKPLTLRQVAEQIDMHESTISRVTSNKYLHCDRGTFEMKYFFTSGVAAADGEGSVSAEAVKAQIRALIDGESADAILSDDTLVDLLREKGFDLARRTVAKYREAIGIGSSVQRRRQKRLARVA